MRGWRNGRNGQGMMEKSLRTLYQAQDFPVFQNRMYSSRKEARDCPKGDLLIVEDQQTGLVYNTAFRQELVYYDANYQNEQAVSPLFHKHLEQVEEIVDEHLGRQSLIEVGCGKAYFLGMLERKGFDITGFDPTYEGENRRVRKEYFRQNSGRKANGLILRHVIEHIANPVGFLQMLKTSNGGQGRIYIEVPCFDWICDHRAWFDIFYEHVNYFRLSDFTRIFGEICDSGRIFGGQYLYVVAELASLRTPKYDSNDAVAFPEDFMRGLTFAEQPVCVWGGASKGVIFSLLRERAGHPVSIVIDVNPAKQGRYLPGTGLIVESPENALKMLSTNSTIYVMNSNYLEEIRSMSDNAYQYVGVDQ